MSLAKSFRHWFKGFPNEPAERLGWGRRDARKKLLEFLLDYADAHPELFRKR